MRSDLVYGAARTLPNRYLLVRAATQAIRKLHRPGARIADTANEVFERFGRANPLAIREGKARTAAARVRRAA